MLKKSSLSSRKPLGPRRQLWAVERPLLSAGAGDGAFSQVEVCPRLPGAHKSLPLKVGSFLGAERSRLGHTISALRRVGY